VNYSFLITFGFAFGAMVYLSRKIEEQLRQLHRGIMNNTEIDSIKYGITAYEHFCLGNNIPPNWDGLEFEQQECWIQMANNIILEYKSDVIKSRENAL
jgi:hypothetical protein